MLEPRPAVVAWLVFLSIGACTSLAADEMAGPSEAGQAGKEDRSTETPGEGVPAAASLDLQDYFVSVATLDGGFFLIGRTSEEVPSGFVRYVDRDLVVQSEWEIDDPARGRFYLVSQSEELGELRQGQDGDLTVTQWDRTGRAVVHWEMSLGSYFPFGDIHGRPDGAVVVHFGGRKNGVMVLSPNGIESTFRVDKVVVSKSLDDDQVLFSTSRMGDYGLRQSWVEVYDNAGDKLWEVRMPSTMAGSVVDAKLLDKGRIVLVTHQRAATSASSSAITRPRLDAETELWEVQANTEPQRLARLRNTKTCRYANRIAACHDYRNPHLLVSGDNTLVLLEERKPSAYKKSVVSWTAKGKVRRLTDWHPMYAGPSETSELQLMDFLPAANGEFWSVIRSYGDVALGTISGDGRSK